MSATPEALKVTRRLREAHGPLVFFQSGGCCDGGSLMCLTEAEMPPAPSDLLLGQIGGAPFYIDSEQYERWGKPTFLIDVSAGPAETFSLEGGEGGALRREHDRWRGCLRGAGRGGLRR